MGLENQDNDRRDSAVCIQTPGGDDGPSEKSYSDLADRIVGRYRACTVLDVGCSEGFLVEALRKRGVSAYGIEPSADVLSHLRDGAKGYCFCGTAAEAFPGELPGFFDLITCIGFWESLSEEDAEKTVRHFCARCGAVLLFSAPGSGKRFSEAARERLERLFAEQGFRPAPDPDDSADSRQRMLFRLDESESSAVSSCAKELHALEILSKKYCFTGIGHVYLGKHGVFQETDCATFGVSGSCSVRQEILLDDDVTSIRFDPMEGAYCAVYNVSIACGRRKLTVSDTNGKKFGEYWVFPTTDPQLTVELPVSHENTLTVSASVIPFPGSEMASFVSAMQEHTTYIETKAGRNARELATLQAQFAALRSDMNTVLGSFSWRLTKPMRAISGGLKRLLRSNRFTATILKGLSTLRRCGFRSTWKVVIFRLHHREAYRLSRASNNYTEEELQKQRKHKFGRDVKFSILVPLYNTPIPFLRDMIQSVQSQTYSNWELCLVDGSDAAHGDVEKAVRKFAEKDARIRYQKLPRNLGISDNTNACMDMATGNYIGLFDHDDILHPAALYEVMAAICEKDADFIYTDENTFRKTPEDAYCPHFKPDFAPDTLRGNNYICHFTVFSRALQEKVGGFRSECDGSQDYDMVLRLTEKAKHIVHIPKILYYWRASAASVASDVSAKPYVLNAAKLAISDHLARLGMKAEIENTRFPSIYRLRYELTGTPLISILIPTRDHADDLKRCLDSVLTLSTYLNYEIILIENGSEDPATFAYYDQLRPNPRIKIVTWDGPFNYSAINNFGFRYASGDQILLLNNDIEIISPDWLQEMLMFSQRSDVGAVGIKMYYPDDTIQHAGVIIGLGGVAGHSHKSFPRDNFGYMGRLVYAQNMSAVTGACMMIPRHVYEETRGLDESFAVAFNDVDFCMRIRKAGYLIVFTPFAEVYHYESKSRGLEDTPEKQKRFRDEIERFRDKWDRELRDGDPYYNPNFSLDSEDFRIRTDTEAQPKKQ